MINYIREQFLVHAAGNAKKLMKHKGHTLKKNMPTNVSSKNALRVARFRKKNTTNIFEQELQQHTIKYQQENRKLQEEMSELKHQLKHYQELYGLKKPTTIHQVHKKQLQEIISLQRELIDNQLETKKLYKAKKISKKEYEDINSQLEKNLHKLNAKKKEILTS